MTTSFNDASHLAWPIAETRLVPSEASIDEDPRADVFIQWKGTDVCFDLNCPCGNGGHYDGYFAYRIRCASCGAEYVMPTTIIPLPADQAEGVYPHDPVIVPAADDE